VSYINTERIGVLGICGGGRYAFNAAMADYRFKCCVGMTPVDFGRLSRETFANFDPVGILEKIAKQRTLKVQGTERYILKAIPKTVSGVKKMTSNIDITEANECYKTERGKAPHRCTSFLFSFNSVVVVWDAFQNAETIMTRPFIAVVGDRPGGFGAYRDSHEIHGRAASKDKRVVVISGFSHYQLYDRPEVVKPALEEALPFFKKHLNEAQQIHHEEAIRQTGEKQRRQRNV
jgi:fermentation-respiration switch protein FrsA (DUF1100 family)